MIKEQITVLNNMKEFQMDRTMASGFNLTESATTQSLENHYAYLWRCSISAMREKGYMLCTIQPSYSLAFLKSLITVDTVAETTQS